jgi:hypothetical protein
MTPHYINIPKKNPSSRCRNNKFQITPLYKCTKINSCSRGRNIIFQRTPPL